MQSTEIPRHLQTIWNGQPLDGKRVLVRCYHGLGDTLQFVRFCAPLRRMARSVTVWAQPALLDLLHYVEGIDVLLPLHDGTLAVEYDVDIESMELPRALGIDESRLCDDHPYLRVTPTSVPFFDGDGELRIGLQWRGGDWERRRSIDPPLLAELLGPLDGATFYSLQYPSETLSTHIAPLAQRSLLDTARGMLSLDLVISIDSVSAHLAGAMGLPTWVLLPHDCDWRWRHAEDFPSDRSRWYPSARLFRQRRQDDWSSVLDEVRRGVELQVKAARDIR